jgi:hypothetical protein
MKLLPILLLLSGLAGAQSFHQINVTWTNPNSASANGWPNCVFTSGPQNMCVEGFTLSEGSTVIATTCTATVTTGCLSALATSFIITPLPAAGNHTYSLVANGLNQTGGPAPSTAATVTVGVPSSSPNPPSAIGATLQ